MFNYQLLDEFMLFLYQMKENIRHDIFNLINVN